MSVHRSDVRRVHKATQRCVRDAAVGLRPEAGVSSPLPVTEDGSTLRFAPHAFAYKVAGDGSGPHIRMYGVGEHGHSICVQASNFYPYLYVGLEQLDANLASEAARASAVQQLVDELQEQLLLSAALDYRTQSRAWAPERRVFRRRVAGSVRAHRLVDGEHVCRLHDTDDDSDLHLPIVRWEITNGLPLKGHGENSGYRGAHARRFLKIYFYAPSLVTRARALLHGRHADLGAVQQAHKISKTGGREPRDDTAPDAPEGGPSAATLAGKMHRAAQSEQQTPLRVWRPEPIVPGDFDGESDENDNDAEASVGAPNWELALDLDEDAMADEENAEQSADCAPSLASLPSEIADDATEDSLDESEAREPSAKRARRQFSVRAEHVRDTKKALELRLDRRFERRAMRRVISRIQAGTVRMLDAGNEWPVYEADIDFTLRFALDCGFAPEEWVEVRDAPKWRVSAQELRRSRCQFELAVDYSALSRCDDEELQNTAPKHLIASLDCEMRTGHQGAFPTPELEPMIQTAFIVRDHTARQRNPELPVPERGKFYYRSVSFSLGPAVDCRSDRREYCVDRRIFCFQDEREMLLAIAHFVAELDADIVTGYNTDGFDLPYLLERARHIGVGEEFARAWGRAAGGSALRVRDRSFGSSATGQIQFKDVRAEGMTCLDVLLLLQKDAQTKLRSYKLGAVAALWIQTTKEDVAYSQINTLAQTPAGLATLLSYCEYDALLPLLILEKRLILPEMIEMARITNCPFDVLLKRGQQVRCKCALYKAGAVEQPLPIRFYTRTERERREQSNDTYQGAGVLPPVTGYYENPMLVVDWAGVYPAIDETHNMDPGTLVARDHDLTRDPHIQKDPDPVKNLSLAERRRRAEAAVWRVPDMVRAEPYEEAADADSAVFLIHSFGVGITVKRLSELRKLRKLTKKRMNAAYAAGDTALGDLLNKRQLAIKILANSLYGVYGATTSWLYAPKVSSSITLRGRALLHQMKWIVESRFKQYKPCVRYGDSVTGDTSLVLRVKGIVRTMRVDECAAAWQWRPYGDGDKEACEPLGVEVWQDGGFTPVHRFIRHACNKPLKRVLTHTGVVDCTTDHSLLREDSSVCSPSDVAVGESLLHADDTELIETLNSTASELELREAYAMGLFAADGSAGYYKTRWGVKYTWAINNADLDVLHEAQAVLPFESKVLDTFVSSGVYKLVPCGNIKDPTLSYRRAFYNQHGEKHIPPFILNAPLAAVREFWRGFYAGDGDRSGTRLQPASLRVDQRGKEMVAGLWLLARRMGYNVSINDRTDKLNVFRLTMSSASDSQQRKAATTIKKVRDLPSLGAGEHVYDLETESHHFHVAPGNMVVHNTDSIFVELQNVENFAQAAQVGVEMADEVTNEMKLLYTHDMPEYNVLVLEFEKVFRRIVLWAKKRYAGLKYEYSPKDGSLQAVPGEFVPYMSGLESKRRDVTLLISENLVHVLSLLLDYRYPLRTNLENMRAWVWERMVRPLKDGSINLHKLVITKQLRMVASQYAASSKGGKLPVHVQLAAKLAERAGGEHAATAPRSGDRLPYIVVRGAAHHSVSERPEDPVYALDNGIPLDDDYYRNKHVRPTMLRILGPIMQRFSSQRTLADFRETTSLVYGASDAQRKRQLDNAAAAFLFGHITDYRDPIAPEDREWARNVTAPTEKRESSAARRRPRYQVRKRGASVGVASSVSEKRQATLGRFSRRGARCASCGVFEGGREDGFLCATCITSDEGRSRGRAALGEIARLTRDIESLRDERDELVQTCHDCMGCLGAPRRITCEQSDCPVFWERRMNQASENEAEKRLAVQRETALATRALETLQF